MRLDILLKNVEYTIIQGDVDIDVDDISIDSRNNTKDTVFVWLSDNIAYLYEAICKGAKAIVCGNNLTEVTCLCNISPDIVIVMVENLRKTLGLMSSEYFEHPEQKLFTIGITGTKGKTTTAYMIHTILVTNGIKAGLIGTIETIYNEEWYPQNNTTPESYTIYETFARMVNAGIKAVVMEVSSQGLKMERCAGIVFDIGVFTNIFPDHIGCKEHKDYEEYISCKQKLFKICRRALINADDKESRRIIASSSAPVETYGINSVADNMACDIKLCNQNDKEGVSFNIKGSVDMQVVLHTPGIFNVYNSLCAVSVAKHFRVDKVLTQKALINTRVKGRFEIVPSSFPCTIIIDYAHNALSLENLLTTLKEYKPTKLICCFGCGGNRDKQRRSAMGRVSGRLADVTVVTSDNPRYEEPDSIISDIIEGIQSVHGVYMAIPDRKAAIEYAVRMAKAGDMVVFAGKGHEDYQEVKGEKISFNERFIIRDLQEE